MDLNKLTLKAVKSLHSPWFLTQVDRVNGVVTVANPFNLTVRQMTLTAAVDFGFLERVDAKKVLSGFKTPPTSEFSHLFIDRGAGIAQGIVPL